MAKKLYGFNERNVSRIERAVRWVEANTGRIPPRPRTRKPRGGSGLEQIYFGKPTVAFSSGTTITLDPCDITGTDLSEDSADNVTCYLQGSQASYSMTNSTTIPVTAICPYVRGADGYFYLLGNPIEIVTDIDVTSTVMTKKTRNAWVLTVGTESAVVNVDTFTTDCP